MAQTNRTARPSDRPMGGPPMGGPGRGPGPGGFARPKHTRMVIRKLMDYLAGGRGKFLLGLVVLCLIGSTICNVGGTYMANVVIIEGLVSGTYTSTSAFVSALTVLIVVYLVGVVCTYLQSKIMVTLAQRGVNRLRRDLFNHLQTLPLTYFDKHTHGELMSRFSNDADQVQTALEQSVVNLFSSAALFTGLVLAMLFLSPLLFIVTALTIVASFFTFKIFGVRSRKSFQAQQKSLGEMNGNIQEMIEGLKVVKAFTHEDQAKADFARLNEVYRLASTDANFNGGAIMPISVNIMNIGYALTAAFGGALALLTPFKLGALLGYLQYARQIGQPMNQSSQQINTVLSALAGAERIFQAMEEKPEVDQGRVTLVSVEKSADGTLTPAKEGAKTPYWAWKVPHNDRFTLEPYQEGWAWHYPEGDPAAGYHPLRGAVTRCQGYDLAQVKGAVRFRDVVFGYVPDKTVLKSISVYANPGQKIAFVGSTGAGKTTITNLINRFYEIQEGVITYDGIDVKEIAKPDLRHSLGAVLQDTHLFTGTVMENLRYGKLDATDEDCIQAAKTAGAHSFIRRLPEGYQTMVTGDGANLSQGQRQLLGIARAAVADPPVMILDEATSSIDTRTERLIEKGMDALMEGRTVFVIAHRLSTVRNSSAIMVIEGGQIVERGSHQELLDQEGRYHQLYTGQFELD